MCGIAGIWSRRLSREHRNEVTLRMCDVLLNRGPDDSGIWSAEESGVTLGQRRLAIIDLTHSGHQPKASPSSRFVTTFNGEIYNYRDLRLELERQGRKFGGNSDTEVLLQGFEEWGFEETIKRAIGMFALAAWDQVEKRLHVARDRVGEKPFYYGFIGDDFVFASEPAAFSAHPMWQGKIDRDALAEYFRFGYIPAPFSIYEGVSKLRPGHYGALTESRWGRMESKPYWDLSKVVETRKITDGTFEDASQELEARLQKTVTRQMISEVPLGAFLSGGVDSSTIVSLMQKVSSRPVKTFTIGFTEEEYNEAPYAEAVAKHLRTDHTTLYVRPEEAREVIPLLPQIYDEPFADSSQIPTYLVSKLARSSVTVSLSGDGGDELFGGYTRYLVTKSILQTIGKIPRPLRVAAGRGISLVSPETWALATKIVYPLLPPKLRYKHPGEKAQKLASIFACEGHWEVYRLLVSYWPNPEEVVKERPQPGSPDHLAHLLNWGNGNDLTENMMLADTLTYLPDDIMAKVDRASMGVSLEGRAPFLDHEIVEYAWSLPLSYKTKDGAGKLILKDVLKRHVPESLTERPKKGFSIPLDCWLRGPLRQWAEDLLNPDKIQRQGYLKPETVQRLWREHQAGRRNWLPQLWTVLMFQSWIETYIHPLKAS